MDETVESTPKRSGFNPMILLAGLVLLLGVGAVVLLGTNKSNKVETSTMQPSATAVPSPTTAASPSGSMGQVQEFTVEGGAFYFKPNELKVKKGQKVKITFQNSGGMHDFVIDEFNVATDVIRSGQTATVEFTPDKTGTFEFYCSVANHRAMGMKGNLIVE